MTLRCSNMMFRAFAEASRLRILNLLLEGELCVCDLCDTLKVLQPRISRHLAYLKRAGLVQVRTQGRWKHYALATDSARLHSLLLDSLKSCLREMDVLQNDLKRLHSLQARKHPDCCKAGH